MFEVPLSVIAPIRFTSDSPNGVFYPFKPKGDVMMAVVWDNQPHLMYLTGEKPFACYLVRAGTSARGSIITDVEFRVDVSSQYDAVSESDPLGALVLENGNLSVMAYRPGVGFEDLFELPLWGSFREGNAEEKIGFSRWSIIARDKERIVTLWSSDGNS